MSAPCCWGPLLQLAPWQWTQPDQTDLSYAALTCDLSYAALTSGLPHAGHSGRLGWLPQGHHASAVRSQQPPAVIPRRARQAPVHRRAHRQGARSQLTRIPRRVSADPYPKEGASKAAVHRQHISTRACQLQRTIQWRAGSCQQGLLDTSQGAALQARGLGMAETSAGYEGRSPGNSLSCSLYPAETWCSSAGWQGPHLPCSSLLLHARSPVFQSAELLLDVPAAAHHGAALDEESLQRTCGSCSSRARLC